MPIDSDPIVSGTPAPDSFVHILLDIAQGIQYKFLFMMFIVFMFLSSDIFVNRILSSINGAVEYKTTTSYGTCIQGVLLVIAMMVLDAAINQNVI